MTLTEINIVMKFACINKYNTKEFIVHIVIINHIYARPILQGTQGWLENNNCSKAIQ